MAGILKHPRPRIAEVQCSRIQFRPGDRVLVRVHQDLSAEQVNRLRKSVEKWAGDQVEVLIVNCLQMEVEVDQRASRLQIDSQG